MEHPDVQALNTEYPSQMSSVVFQSENHPWDNSKVEVILGRTVPGDEALAEIKPVYYPKEEKLVSLDVLKLYCGEDMICQDPEDKDLD